MRVAGGCIGLNNVKTEFSFVYLIFIYIYIYIYIYFPPVALRPNAGHGLLILEVS